jgi:hypothetical protein
MCSVAGAEAIQQLRDYVLTLRSLVPETER